MNQTIIQHETAVIGCLLLPDEVTTLANVKAAGLTPSHFSTPHLAEIYRVICESTREGYPVDFPTIEAKIGRATREALGPTGVCALVDAAPTAAHAEYHARQVRMAALGRLGSKTCQRYAGSLTTTDNPEAELARLSADVTDLQSKGQSVAIRHLTDFRAEKVEQWRLAVGRGYVGIPSSLREINQYLGGYRPSVMCVLGGYRGQGKSTLARQEALGLARAGYKVLICSMEDPGDIAAAGIAGNYSGRSVFHLDTGAKDQHGETAIDRVDADWASLSDLPLWIASGAMKIEDIESAATIHHARHGLDFLVIDHIQFINPYKLPGMDRNGTVATYSQRIVGLLARHKIPALVLSQLSRDSEKEDRKPRLSDLRDSGCIEQDARQVLLLYGDAETKTHRLEIAKNNFGVSGKTFAIRRIDGMQRFELLGEV